MVGLVQVFEAMLGHVRINFGRRNVRVPQHDLDRSQVRIVLDQVSGEGMPQCVW